MAFEKEYRLIHLEDDTYKAQVRFTTPQKIAAMKLWFNYKETYDWQWQGNNRKWVDKKNAIEYYNQMSDVPVRVYRKRDN